MTTETAVAQPADDPRVLALYQESQHLQATAEAQAIETDADVQNAADTLNVMVGVKKAIEQKRVEYVGPLNTRVKAANEEFKTYVFPLIEGERILKQKVGVYRAELERVRRAEEEINRKRQEASREEMELKGELTESVNLVEVTPERSGPYRGQTANLIGKKVWRFEVEDFAKLSDDFKEPNLVKIRSVVIAMKQEGYPIPGVRVWQEEELAVAPRTEQVARAPVAAITAPQEGEAPPDAFPDPGLPF